MDGENEIVVVVIVLMFIALMDSLVAGGSMAVHC